MNPLHYRLLNVFTSGDDPFSGNPLCVFEDADGLPDDVMQALARQFNLSETTFVTPSEPEPGVTATVRVFTPSIELPFAGHPTLGTAHVVRDICDAGDDILLRMAAADVPVAAVGDRWTLRAKQPAVRDAGVSREDVARMVGLPPSALAADPMWVDTGVEQLLLPLHSAHDVRSARADPALLERFAMGSMAEALVYLWAPVDEETVEARLFFTQDGAVVEDPATGSACANLGAWFHARGDRAIRRRVRQGAAVRRPSVLDLEVDQDGAIFVAGTVRELGRGTIRI
jgi:trans-2,3-dihydro-3-hydroxyanthranilate isomerase